MRKQLSDLYSTSAFRASAHRIVDLLADHLESSNCGEMPALPWIEPDDAEAFWSQAANGQMSPEAYCRALLAGSVRISDPKYMGHQICYPAPAAMLAGFMVDCLNNGSGVYEMGMAGTSMEKILIRSLADRLGFSRSAGGFLTSGGTLANLTAMLAARAKALGESTDDARPMAVMVSAQAHYCIERAVHVMGWGQGGIVHVPVDSRYKMRTECLPELFEQATAQGRRVVAIVGSSCTTSTGSFDPLEDIAAFAEEHQLWFHVDAAHGGAVAYSDRHRHLIQGIQLADSVTIDFHKMMLTPALCSGLVFRQERNSFKTFALRANYLFADQDAADDTTEETDGNTEQTNPPDHHNLARRTFECTKSMMAAKAFSILAIHGAEAWSENVDHLHGLTQEFAELIRQTADFELALAPETNILCFRHRRVDETPQQNSERMTRVRETLKQRGEFYIVSTTLDDATWLRSTISNPFTTPEHMRQLLGRIATAI